MCCSICCPSTVLMCAHACNMISSTCNITWILFSLMDTAQFFFTENNSSYSKCHTGMIKSHRCAVSLSKAIPFIDLQSYYSLHALCSWFERHPFYNSGLKGIIMHSSTGQITFHMQCTEQTITAFRGDSSWKNNSPCVLTLQWKGSQLHSCGKGTL